jgi:hypothetical protein
MCTHTLCIDIAMQILQRTVYPQFSSAQFDVDKTSFLGSLGMNTFSALKICQFLLLVKEVSGAYNMPTLFCSDCGAVARLPHNHLTRFYQLWNDHRLRGRSKIGNI